VIATRIFHTYTDIVTRRGDPLAACTGFDWDEDNTHKAPEDVFLNGPLVVPGGKRYYALGQTTAGRRLFVAFTIRRSMLRVISVRDMNGKESGIYAQREKEAGA
jgi:uncharacterized protein